MLRIEDYREIAALLDKYQDNNNSSMFTVEFMALLDEKGISLDDILKELESGKLPETKRNVDKLKYFFFFKAIEKMGLDKYAK